jgi:glycosyltransferase involved in cell wall biosynthesis
MRIAFIGQKGIPAKFGGVERHVEELSVKLAEMGHEVFVYSRKNYTPKDIKEYRGVNLIHLPSITTKHLDAISHTFFASIHLLIGKFDVIHFHSIGPSLLVWLVKILNPGVPVVATFHAKCYTHKKWGIMGRTALKLGEKSICHFPDKTITISRVLHEYAQNKYGKTFEYAPNGVAEAETKEAGEIKKWGLEKGNYILSVSRLVRHKGIHYLINSYNKIDNAEKKLVIAGDGAYTDDYVKELKMLAADNPNIIFTGNQTGDALSELYSNAYLFVQPSESEGLSIALLEALSYSNAVLASDIPENREVVDETGFLFENKNEDDLRRKLQYLMRNADVLEVKKAYASEFVKKHYNWENISSSINDIYKSAIIEKASRRHAFRKA